MQTISANIRKEVGRQTNKLRSKGILPAVLYGPKTETLSLEVDEKDFEKIFQEEGESSLISLELEKKKFLVLIHAIEIDAISKKTIHVDFYQPRLDEEISAEVPLVFTGESVAVKELGGTLIKNIHEIEVKALPQNLPHEIKVDLGKLKTFEDNILIKDLIIPQGVKIMKGPDEMVALVSQKVKVEEDLKKPVEEKVEEVGKVEDKKKDKEEAEEKPKSSSK
ncbi:MAG: 50S ribosomal protein L25 [Candidatus Nealsonbacteria bacterium]|nr:50S ribosomal protein L25 [Candidatus Nealsonbacteria bacterium]